jgi:hypothetical protein
MEASFGIRGHGDEVLWGPVKIESTKIVALALPRCYARFGVVIGTPFLFHGGAKT